MPNEVLDAQRRSVVRQMPSRGSVAISNETQEAWMFQNEFLETTASHAFLARYSCESKGRARFVPEQFSNGCRRRASHVADDFVALRRKWILGLSLHLEGLSST